MDEPAPPTPLLTTFLAERDAPCPCCGYNLRALPGARCPECNQQLVLQVGLAEPKLAWFVAGLVGIGMSSGFCTLLLAWAGYMIVFSGGFGAPRRDLVPLVLGTLVGAALMAVWLRARRSLMSASPERRWTLAIAAAGFCLICPLWFFAIAR